MKKRPGERVSRKGAKGAKFEKKEFSLRPWRLGAINVLALFG
jgi:hypothetical protein